jgi:hypothetical protein
MLNNPPFSLVDVREVNMAKLTKRQEELCNKYEYYPNKHNLLCAMHIEHYFPKISIIEINSIFDYMEKLYNEYTLKDLDEMLDYKQLRVQDFCEMKEY